MLADLASECGTEKVQKKKNAIQLFTLSIVTSPKRADGNQTLLLL
jgi:hypothetical protein